MTATAANTQTCCFTKSARYAPAIIPNKRALHFRKPISSHHHIFVRKKLMHHPLAELILSIIVLSLSILPHLLYFYPAMKKKPTDHSSISPVPLAEAAIKAFRGGI
jgi:hypothetical protein